MHSISEHAIHLIEIPLIYIHHVFLPSVIGFNDYEILIDLEMFFMQHLKKKLLLLLFKHDVLIMCDRFFEP